jgi:streptogramin lyase
MTRKVSAASPSARKMMSIANTGKGGRTCVAALILIGVVLIAAASAPASEAVSQVKGLPTAEGITMAITGEAPGSIHQARTDPHVAESVPLQDLGRAEAIGLMRGVFEPELQSPAGIFDELHIERFLGPGVAVISASEPPAAVVGGDETPAPVGDERREFDSLQSTEKKEFEGQANPGEEEGSEAVGSGILPVGQGRVEGAMLLDSTVPLRIEGPSGQQEAVDLTLEQREDGRLRPANPLVEVGISQALSEGIELPGPDVGIELVDAPVELHPSIVDGSVAVYPNVAKDTDLAVAPTPTGVETLTQVRSAESPRSESFQLNLPPGATLQPTDDGGAVVKGGENTLVGISPPTALDAEGTEVPVSLTVSDNSLTLTVSPAESAAYPLLVDPLFQTYEWENSNWWKDGICSDSFEAQVENHCNNREEWGIYAGGFGSGSMSLNGQFWGYSSLISQGTPGLFIKSHGTLNTGAEGAWIYTVPRYFTELEENGTQPTSFISHMTLSRLLWQAQSEHPSPYVFAGLWDTVHGGWASYYSHEGLVEHGLNDLGWHYEFPNPNANADVKAGMLSIQATESQPNSNTDVYVGAATVELADKDAPGFGSISGPSQWVDQSVQPIDFMASDSGLGVFALNASIGSPTQSSWKTQYGCVGVGNAACPRTWAAGEPGPPSLKYEPSAMPQGIDYLNVVAEDPVGNKSSPAFAQVKVDHTAPTLNLSGSITEEEALGTKRPTYGLKYSATDGEAKAAEALAPFGTVEAGDLQMKRPLGIAADGHGHVWMVDREADCVKEFDEEGHYISRFGSTGSGDGQLQGPSNIAISPAGNLWVTDTGNRRVEEFGPSGEYLQSFQPKLPNHNGPLVSPYGIATDTEGSLWIGDAGGNSVAKFRENVGEESQRYVESVYGNPQDSHKGASPEFSTPAGLAGDAAGDVWVVDYGHSRLDEFSASGVFMHRFGSQGTNNGQLKNPYSVAVASSGNLLVTDSGNNRVEEFQPDGEFLRAFGLPRGGNEAPPGDDRLLEPRGFAFGAGNIAFVEDAGDHRIERWSHADYDPQSGVAGIEVKVDGHRVENEEPGCSPKDCVLDDEWTLHSEEYTAGEHEVEVIATDGVGLRTTKDISVDLDPSPPSISLAGSMTQQATLGTTRPRYNLRVHASAIAGLEGGPSPGATFATAFGSYGSGNGQLNSPGDVAVGSSGHVWVADAGNNRIEEFNQKGEYVSQLGAGELNYPAALAVDSGGHIWVADTSDSCVKEFNEAGALLGEFGSPGSGEGQLSEPFGITVDHSGNIWVADTFNSRIEEFSPQGEYLSEFGAEGSGDGELFWPTGIAAGPGGKIWVADLFTDSVEEFDEDGEFLGALPSEQLSGPISVTADSKGEIWVADIGSNHVVGFDETGAYIAQFGSEGAGEGQFHLDWPTGLATNAKGEVWVADTDHNRVQRWQLPAYLPTISTAFGSYGSGDGQLSYPGDVAVGSSGHVWVADAGNNRIEEFNQKGEYVSQLGAGELNYPAALAVDSGGHIWVADTSDSCVKEFNEAGALLGEFGSPGSGEGQLSEPFGITVDHSGNIWVADTFNSRIEEFSPQGEYLSEFGAEGSGDGELFWPTGIAAGPGGKIWVADLFTDSVEEFDEDGEFLGALPSEQLSGPISVTADSKGEIWVADIGSNHVVGFDETGAYIAQFGSEGAGEGQFHLDWPTGLATNAKGEVWVADTGHNRVQRWAPAAWLSEVQTEIFVDGQQVDSAETGCGQEQCPIIREWTLQSPGVSVGQHIVEVHATDGLGNTATKTLPIEIQRDTTKPTIEAAGELIEAPKGWVEQESYALAATAEDGGYGVTSLSFKIDGEAIASTTTTCPEGGCEAAVAKSVDMANYSGGAHEAELIATDGAGNSDTKHWTINVDPEGHISTGEAEDTLEAVDATSESNVVSPTSEVLEPEQIEGGDNPGLLQHGSEIESTGIPDTTTMTTDPKEGFTVHSPERDTLITPSVGSTASEISIAEGVAGVSANVEDEVDTVIRPEYNGVQTFQAIRSESSPSSFSWTVHLAEGQSLQAINDEFAEVAYEDGHTAFLITADQAHDATGAAVPTTLEVDGNVLILNVAIHSAQFVYPVVQGTGWETSYPVPVVVEGPEDETEVREREEEERRREQEELEAEGGEEAPPPPPPSGDYFSLSEAESMMQAGAVEEIIPVPAPPSGGEASASSVMVKTVKPLNPDRAIRTRR